MDFFDNPYYKLNNRLLSFIGQWPYQSDRKKRILRTLVVLFIMTILIPELIKLRNIWGNLDIVFECIPPLGLHAINVIKWSNCVANMNKLKTLLMHMERDWTSRKDGNGSDILRKYAGRGRLLTVAYACYMYISAGLYVCIPILPIFLDMVKPLNESRPRESLFHAEYFVDQNKYFFPIFLHAFFTNFTSVTIVVAFDTMYGAYIQYACAMFAELGEQLVNVVKNGDSGIEASKNKDYTYHRIVKCVQKHKDAIEFYNLLESSYMVYFLFVTGTSILLMSFTGVQTVMRLEDPKLALRYGSFTLGQVVHVFFGCWHGQLLIDHSLHINEAVYKSKWYRSSFRSRKLLRLIMMRSGYPCQLSAGKLFFVSLETFSIVIKTAMSYFTVLTSLR